MRSNGINIPVVIAFIIPAMVVYFIMSEKSSLASNTITFSFFYVFAVFIYRIANKKIEKSDVIRIFILSSIVFLNVMVSGIGDFDYFKKAIMFVTTVVWIICSYNTLINKRTVFIILLINIIINYLYVMFYQLGFSIFDGQVLLTLNFTNPNQTGMFLLNSVLYLGIAIFAGYSLKIKKKYYIFLLIILMSLLFRVFELLILTGCRSSFLSIMIFLALIIANEFIPTKNVLSKPVCTFFSVMPFLAVFIYLWNVESLSMDVSFGMEEAGKANTTRVHIWRPIIDNFFHYVLFGDYYGISDGTGMSQMHNTHLDVFASYGIIPLIMYCVVIYRAIRKCADRATGKFQTISLFAFISCLISGTFEASFVSGGACLFLLTTGFLMLANYQPNESTTDKCCSRPRKHGQDLSVR